MKLIKDMNNADAKTRLRWMGLFFGFICKFPLRINLISVLQKKQIFNASWTAGGFLLFSAFFTIFWPKWMRIIRKFGKCFRPSVFGRYFPVRSSCSFLRFQSWRRNITARIRITARPVRLFRRFRIRWILRIWGRFCRSWRCLPFPWYGRLSSRENFFQSSRWSGSRFDSTIRNSSEMFWICRLKDFQLWMP